MQWQLSTLWDIRWYAEDWLLEVTQPNTNVRGKHFVLNCCSVLVLKGRIFLPNRHRWQNLGSSLQGDESQLIEWHHPQSPRKSFKTTSAGKVMITAFGTMIELLWWMWWPEVWNNSDKYMKQIQKLKHDTGECGLTGIQETWLFDTKKIRPHTSLRTHEAITKFHRTVLPYSPCSPWSGAIRFSSVGAIEGCNAWDKVRRR